MIEYGKLIQLRTKLLEKILNKSKYFDYVIHPEGTLYVMARFNKKARINNQEQLFIETRIEYEHDEKDITTNKMYIDLIDLYIKSFIIFCPYLYFFFSIN